MEAKGLALIPHIDDHVDKSRPGRIIGIAMHRENPREGTRNGA